MGRGIDQTFPYLFRRIKPGIYAYLCTCTMLGFEGFSPYTLPNVIEISEGIPYIDMTRLGS